MGHTLSPRGLPEAVFFVPLSAEEESFFIALFFSRTAARLAKVFLVAGMVESVLAWLQN